MKLPKIFEFCFGGGSHESLVTQPEGQAEAGMGAFLYSVFRCRDVISGFSYKIFRLNPIRLLKLRSFCIPIKENNIEENNVEEEYVGGGYNESLVMQPDGPAKTGIGADFKFF